MILDIATAWYPNYNPEHYHQYLIYVGLVCLAIAFNIFGSGWLPFYNQLIFVLAILTLTSTAIALFAASADNHTSAEFIFTDITNRSGWSSDGWAFMLAVGNTVYAFLGTDCGAHMCEEIPNPSKNVPKVMFYPLLMGLATAFPFAVSLMYSSKNLERILNTPTGFPLFEIYYQGTGSRAASSILLALFAFCFFSNLIANG